MKYIDFHNTPLAQIALGCDHYGATISETTALKQLDLYRTMGGNLLDTALVYGQEKAGEPSTSEQVIGRWLSSNDLRPEMVIATKGCHPHKENMHHSRISEREMIEDISRSLDQLKTDYVDIWFFHRDNPAMGADEIIDMAQSLVEQKLVRHLGASNWTTSRIEAANSWAHGRNKRPFAISEIQWSLAHCTPKIWGDDTLVCMNESEHAWYTATAMPVMAFAPQAKGLFSKLINGDEKSLSETARRRFLTERNLALVPEVRALSEELGVSAASVVIAYLTSQPNPTIAIAGSSRIEQLSQTLSASSLTLSAQQLATLG